MFDLFADSKEGLLDCFSRAGTHLVEGDWGCRSGVLLGQRHALLKGYPPLRLKVLLISEDSLRDAWRGLLADLRHPGIQILEGVPVSN